MKLTKAKAKEYCLIKWKYAMKTGCTNGELLAWLEKKHSHIRNLDGACGYCEYYGCDLDLDENQCPLNQNRLGTCDKYFFKWAEEKSIDKRKELATLIYEDIERS